MGLGRGAPESPPRPGGRAPPPDCWAHMETPAAARLPPCWGSRGTGRGRLSPRVVLPLSQAFRQLSHRFHGKGSGKMKTERRMKKLDEEAVSAPGDMGVASERAGGGWGAGPCSCRW